MLLITEIENILDIKIDKVKDGDSYLTHMGIDSMKLIELGAYIEDKLNIIITSEKLFDIKIKHLFLDIDEFKFVVLNELDDKYKKYLVDDSPVSVMGGYCSLLRDKHLISSSEFLKLLKYKDLYLCEESPHISIKQEILLFIQMSRVCTDKFKYDKDLFDFFKLHFKPIQESFKNVDLNDIITCNDFFIEWAKFNVKIIHKIDPTLNVIPGNISEKTLVVKYL